MADPKSTGQRVTPKGTKPGVPSATRKAEPVRKAVRRPATDASGDTTPAPGASARYTPKQSGVVMRPGWHRIIGWVGVALGILIAILNDAQRISDDVTLIPFGHSELYLLLGFAIAGGSTWFLGLFERQTVYC